MKRIAGFFLAALLGLACLSMGKRTPSHVVSFHLQTNADYASAARIFEWPPGTGYVYDKAPVIHQQQIQSFSAFDGDDGGWGVVFRLTTGGRNALEAACAERPGKYLVAVVQGLPRSIVQLDRYVDDGQLVLWEGLRPEDMELFEKTFRLVE